MYQYPKQILTITQQVQSYIDAEMEFANQANVEKALKSVGYYRLRGYSFHLYDNATKKYVPGTKFEDILKLYQFDQELATLIFAMISKYGNVYIRNIVYIESCGHLMIIQMADGKVIKQYGSLRVMEEGLSQYHFLRTHKSYLVNARYIKDIGKREIYLTNGAMLEIGRDRRKSLLQVIYKMDEFN